MKNSKKNLAISLLMTLLTAALMIPTLSVAGFDDDCCYDAALPADNSVVYAACEHVVSYRRTIKNATCTECGEDAMICKTCQCAVYTITTDPVGHDYQYSTSEPTCTEKGYEEAYCTRCNERKTIKSIPALGHDYVVTIYEPTCINKGIKITRCTRCSPEEGGEGEIEILPALGHIYVTEVSEPTCTEKGVKTTKCLRCDYIQ